MTHKARKRFGQNFLVDQNIIRNIIHAVHPLEGEWLLEVGPGRGALTEHLIKSRSLLHIVEIDRDLVAWLHTRFDASQLTIHQDDILYFELQQLGIADHQLRVIGNLPYNISTPLIFHLLSQGRLIRDMLFMLQKEVVTRLVAQPGSKAYGRLSVMVQYYCEVEALFDVPPTAFQPQPKVWSAVVRLTPFTTIPCVTNNPMLFDQLVKVAFNQRRKTLRNSLKTLITAEHLRDLGIDPNKRPEELSVKDYVTISNAIQPTKVQP